jgi:hypothetical protein
MSAIPPLSGDKPTSGERAKNDANDPEPEVERATTKPCPLTLWPAELENAPDAREGDAI